jgi:polar amino acid transport system substrate-binding protein
MKKGLMVLLIFVLIFGLIGCSSEAPEETEEQEQAGEQTEEQEEVETLKVGTSADFPPFENHEVIDGEDTIVGFDIDLINEIGKEIGVEIEIEDMDFNGLVAAVQSEKIDMAIAGMAPDEERKEKVDFSDPYYYASQTILVKEDAEELTNMDQLKGKQVGSQLGTTSDDVISEFEGVEVKKFNKVNDAVLDLKNGRLDAVILEDSIADAYVEKNPELKVVVPEGLNEGEDPFAIALPKGNEELLNKVNDALQKIKDSGKYDELISKWFE